MTCFIDFFSRAHPALNLAWRLMGMSMVRRSVPSSSSVWRFSTHASAVSLH